MSSNVETLLTDLTNGTQPTLTPRTRVEEYLKACCDKCGCADVPTPISRVDTLLYNLAEQIASGANTPVEVSTAAAMNALLVSANVGKVYKYTGTTTADYTNGDIYIVESGD